MQSNTEKAHTKKIRTEPEAPSRVHPFKTTLKAVREWVYCYINSKINLALNN